MPKDRLPELQNVLVIHSRLTTCCDEIIQGKGALEYGYEALMNREYVHDFLCHITAVWQDISWIRENVEKLRFTHSQMVASPFVDSKMKRQAEDKTESIQQMAKKVYGKIQECEKDYLREQQENPTSALYRIIGMQRTTLTRVYYDVMTYYNTCQTEFKMSLRDRFKRQLDIAGRTANDEEVEEMLEKGSIPTIFTQEIKFIDAERAKQVLAEIEERHKEMMDLEKAIIALKTLFTDMALLVEDQGDKIDLIEESILRSVDFCAKAAKETKKASVYVKSRRKLMIISAGVSGLILLIVIITLVSVFGK